MDCSVLLVGGMGSYPPLPNTPLDFFGHLKTNANVLVMYFSFLLKLF